MSTGEVLCVGEILWDFLPTGLFLGGAPFNVACHLGVAGVPVAMVSRVGADRLGDEAMRRARDYGVATDLVQIDPNLPTGLVNATIDESGEARYVILDGAAWDAIELNETLLARAENAAAIVFGSLAQRHATTRGTIERLSETKALAVFDLNLRPPYEDRDVIVGSLRRADVLKVNSGELQRLAGWFGLPSGERESASALSRLFSCPVVCVTRGRNGAALWRDEVWVEHPGFEVQVRDTVGAGDAFLARLLAGLLAGANNETLLKDANRSGADVAAQFGALPIDSFPSLPTTEEEPV